MLYLGCPAWASAQWKGSLYAIDTKAADFLSVYSQYFNSVEGNTTFYSDPTADTLLRWRLQTADNFRFVLKVPQRISHQNSGDIIEPLRDWLNNLAALEYKLAMVHLQLPAHFGPDRLGHISAMVKQISQHYRCALEVRHLAFFDKATHEISLHKMLQLNDAERVIFDSRALFSVPASSPALLDAQAKKPQLPVHAISFSQTPMLRFIGTDNMDLNRQFYQPWLVKIKQWLAQGKHPYCFFHTPDNHLAPILCRQFVQDLQYSHACSAPWPGEQQYSLL
uniref:DUF72 domain-containing protein n=1 Tax=Rheinheimera sp. BAL341 TaxID=1708203 RepID=A0A486XI63_9GAMM